MPLISPLMPICQDWITLFGSALWCLYVKTGLHYLALCGTSFDEKQWTNVTSKNKEKLITCCLALVDSNQLNNSAMTKIPQMFLYYFYFTITGIIFNNSSSSNKWYLPLQKSYGFCWEYVGVRSGRGSYVSELQSWNWYPSSHSPVAPQLPISKHNIN